MEPIPLEQQLRHLGIEQVVIRIGRPGYGASVEPDPEIHKVDLFGVVDSLNSCYADLGGNILGSDRNFQYGNTDDGSLFVRARKDLLVISAASTELGPDMIGILDQFALPHDNLMLAENLAQELDKQTKGPANDIGVQTFYDTIQVVSGVAAKKYSTDRMLRSDMPVSRKLSSLTSYARNLINARRWLEHAVTETGHFELVDAGVYSVAIKNYFGNLFRATSESVNLLDDNSFKVGQIGESVAGVMLHKHVAHRVVGRSVEIAFQRTRGIKHPPIVNLMIGKDEQTSELMIICQDNGRALSQEAINQIFQEHTEPDLGIVTIAQSNVFGYWLMNSIVRRRDGTMQIRSIPGKEIDDTRTPNFTEVAIRIPIANVG